MLFIQKKNCIFKHQIKKTIYKSTKKKALTRNTQNNDDDDDI